MSGPNGETIIVLPMKPRGAEYVRCPKCGLVGWRESGEPMFCPDDFTEAETFDPETQAVKRAQDE